MNLTFTLTDEIVAEAEDYAVRSCRYTTNRHDFHEGGLAGKARKMFEAKLGEKAFRAWLQQEGIPFEEDATAHTQADLFDYRIGQHLIDVKTHTQDFHRLLLELVEVFAEKPKDFYVAVRLRFTGFNVVVENGQVVFNFSNVAARTATLLGYARKNDVEEAPIRNQGYRDNYTLNLAGLRPMLQLPSDLVSSELV